MLSMIRYAGVKGLSPAVAWAAPHSPLDPALPAVRSLANLHAITLVIATIVFLIVCGLLIYSLVRVRRKVTNHLQPDGTSHGNITLEVIWTVIPVAILAILVVLTYQAL